MPRGKTSLWPLAAIALVVILASAAAWKLGYFEHAQRDRLIAAIGDVRGSWIAAAIFIGCWILAILLCLPTTVITVVGGALFGTLRGAAFSWSAALIGTAIAHVLARSLTNGAIRRLFGSHRLLRKLGDDSSIWTLVRLRVVPAAPFGVVDYVAGLAGVPLRSLLAATAIGTAPGTIAYAFAGSQLGAGIGGSGAAARKALVIAGAVSLAMLAIAIAPWLLDKLRSRTGRSRPREPMSETTGRSP